jgi:serine phosphatase RsbU (regulator of sigma subunit)
LPNPLPREIDVSSGASEALNAGHPPLLVVQPEGTVRRLKTGETFPLGIEAIDSQTKPDVIAPEDVLLVYSNGWTELCDPTGHMLGVRGLSRSVMSVCRAAATAPLGEILQAVHLRLANFQGPADAHDDRTLMLVRRRTLGG